MSIVKKTTDDDGDGSLAQATKDEKAYRDRLLNGVRLMMKNRETRALLWHLIELTGYHGLSFTNSDRSTCLNEGHREVGLAIKNLLREADRRFYTSLLDEFDV